MKSNKFSYKQAGSTEVAIVMVVVILILGGLGYALYRTLSNDTNSSSVNTDKTQKEPNNVEPLMSVGATDGRFVYTLNFKYPKSWKVETNSSNKLEVGQTAQAGDYADTIITSPSGDITVNYTIFNEPQVGGSCDINSAPKIESVAIKESKNIENTILIEEYHKGDTEDSYQLRALLTNKDMFSRGGIPKVGDSSCLAYDGVFPVELGGAEYVGGINLGVKDDNSSLDKAELKRILESTEYKQAREILLSTVIKKQ